MHNFKVAARINDTSPENMAGRKDNAASKAAAAMGSIKSEKKARASAENERKGPIRRWFYMGKENLLKHLDK